VSPTQARLAVLAAAVLFSTGGAAIKGTALDAFQVAGFRSGVAGLALALLLPEARRGLGRSALFPAALAYAGTLICFVAATKLPPSAAAIFRPSTAPIWVRLLAPTLAGEAVRARDLPYVGVAAAALALVFLGSRAPLATAPQPTVGNVVALASGLFYALLMIALRRLSRRDGSDLAMPATVLGNAAAFAFCMPLALPVEALSLRDAVAIVYLGVIQIGFAYWLFTRALRLLPALEVSLLVLLEPVLNPLWTWLLHGERPSRLASAGGVLLVVALGARLVVQRPHRVVAAPLD